MQKYSRRTIWIHWASTVLILLLLGTGLVMERSAQSAAKLSLYQWHFSMGIAVLILTILRVFAYLKDKRPKPLNPANNKRQQLINFVHKGLYWVISWISISGIVSLIVEGITPALRQNDASLLPDLTQDLSFIMLSHHVAAKFVLLLLIMHVVGVASHSIKTGHNVFNRIT